MPNQFTRMKMVNAYLVAEDDGLTLVDTTLKGAGKHILALAETLGQPIVRVALTHGHSDHVGAVDELAKLLPDAEFSIPARDNRILAGDKSLDEGEAQGKIKGGWPTVTTKFGRLLTPGETIGSLEIHAAPGHTPGQVAFLDPRDGTLYCGDAYATLGGVATCAKGSWKFPLPGLATWDKPTALASAKALRALDPKALAPGHGRVVSDPGAAMDKAIARGA